MDDIKIPQTPSKDFIDSMYKQAMGCICIQGGLSTIDIESTDYMYVAWRKGYIKGCTQGEKMQRAGRWILEYSKSGARECG